MTEQRKTTEQKDRRKEERRTHVHRFEEGYIVGKCKCGVTSQIHRRSGSDRRAAAPASGTEPCCTGSPNCIHPAPVPLDTPPAAPVKIGSAICPKCGMVLVCANCEAIIDPPSPPSEGREPDVKDALEFIDRHCAGSTYSKIVSNKVAVAYLMAKYLEFARASVPAAPEEKP